MLVSIFILFELLGILTSIHAVMQTRTSQGAVAWIVCLIALPVVAVPAYWLFGRNRFNGYVNAWIHNRRLALIIVADKHLYCPRISRIGELACLQP